MSCVSTYDLRRYKAQGLGVVPLITALVSAAPMVMDALSKSKQKSGPSAAELEAIRRAAEAEKKAAKQRTMLLGAGALAVGGAVAFAMTRKRR